MELLARGEKGLHSGCEGGVRRPIIGVAFFVVPANFEGLFKVGVGGAEGGNEGGVGELGYFFAAVGDVAAVGFGGCL